MQLHLNFISHQPHIKQIRGKKIHQTLQNERCDHIFHDTKGVSIKHSKMCIAYIKSLHAENVSIASRSQ